MGDWPYGATDPLPASAGGGELAADLDNLSHLLDVLDAHLRMPPGDAEPCPSLAAELARVNLCAERDSARVFVNRLRAAAPPTSALDWPDEALARLVQALASLGELGCDIEREADARRLQDRRQPGGVPGPGPGELRHTGPPFVLQRVEPVPGIPDELLVPTTEELRLFRKHDPEGYAAWAAERYAASEDSTPPPRYRAPLPDTEPPKGRRFVCGSCARSFLGPVMAGCPCGGDIAVIDPHELRSVERHADGGVSLTCTCGFVVSAFTSEQAEGTMSNHVRLCSLDPDAPIEGS